MELNDEKKELLSKVLEGFIRADDHVFVVAEDSKYQSPNGVISNLERGGSTLNGVIIRIGNNTKSGSVSFFEEAAVNPVKRYKPEQWQTILFMKYEATEVAKDVYLLPFDKIKMYKDEQ